MDQPSIQKGSKRPGKERKQLLNQTSSSGFGDGVGGVRRGERDPSAPSPGRPRLPRASGQQPEPEPRTSPGRGELPPRRALGQQPPGRLRSPRSAADQLRPAGPRLPAPPRPPGTRAPAPGGREGGSGAPGWGPGLPSRLPLSPGSALRDEPPATPQSQRRDSRGWAPWRCPSSRSAPCPE